METKEKLFKFYNELKEIRDRGVLMKDIADAIQLPPSVVSALYTTVLPLFLKSIETMDVDKALDYALSQVNNISKKRLLPKLDEILENLELIEEDVDSEQKCHPFTNQLLEEMNKDCGKIDDYEGIYISYSLSSAAEALKIEPYYIRRSDDSRQVIVGRRSAYNILREGIGIIKEHQTLYILLNETREPQFAMVSIYLPLPLFENPRLLKGLYLSLDYNKNPIARRIVLKKVSDYFSMEEFAKIEAKIVPLNELNEQEELYFRYVGQSGDYIKMCAIPSPKLDERDLELEKQILQNHCQ